ncbi:MFS general substrate transporter [Colletotrichum somersetense]|nr:MFS general substrate transporter [Colletotrichum somersetense]
MENRIRLKLDICIIPLALATPLNNILDVSCIVFEIPSNIICKIIGHGWYLPGITILFGLLTVASAYVNNYSQLAACRFLLGIAESGVMPGWSYYLSRFYRHSELTFRLSLYIVMAPLAGAFGGLLASSILKLKGFGSRIPAGSPETARFLTFQEREIATDRLKEERLGTTIILDKISRNKMIKGAISPVSAATSVCFMLCSLSIQDLALFAPTIVRSIYLDEASVAQQHLLTVPPYAFGAVCLLSICFASWKLDRPVFLMASTSFILGPLCHAQSSANVNSNTSRNISIAICMFFGNTGSLVSTWSFLPNDAPNYPISCGLNFATSTLILITAVGAWVWMRRDNRRKDQVDLHVELASFTVTEAEQLDWKHPAFRWRL